MRCNYHINFNNDYKERLNFLIYNVNVYGLKESLIRSGYPMLTEVDKGFKNKLQEKDLNRGTKLGNAPSGSGHDNFLKGIIVQFDIDFTIKAWTEAERYHWFDIISSCSTMHRISKMDLDKVYIKYVDKRIIAIMKELQGDYNANPTKENFNRLIYSNPVGMKLTAGVTTNYLQLKTIYKQRKNHRLQEWKDFCQWIETLPNIKGLGVQNESNK